MIDQVVAHCIGAFVDPVAYIRAACIRVGCNQLVLDRRGQVRLLEACQLEGLLGFALAGRRDKLASAVGRIAVDIEDTAGMGCTSCDSRNQMLRLAWHKPTNFAVFLQFSRSQPQEGPYF